eukprot:scaffold211383_cov37-Tisochrysis_lutea.AAC.3
MGREDAITPPWGRAPCDHTLDGNRSCDPKPQKGARVLLLSFPDDHGSTINRCACLQIVGHANDPAVARIL